MFSTESDSSPSLRAKDAENFELLGFAPALPPASRGLPEDARANGRGVRHETSGRNSIFATSRAPRSTEISRALAELRGSVSKTLEKAMRSPRAIGFAQEEAKSVDADELFKALSKEISSLQRLGIPSECLKVLKSTAREIDENGWRESVKDGALHDFKSTLFGLRSTLASMRESFSQPSPEERMRESEDLNLRRMLSHEVGKSLQHYEGDITPFLRTLESVFINLRESCQSVEELKSEAIGFASRSSEGSSLDVGPLLQQLQLYSLLCEQVYECCGEDRFSMKQVRIAAHNVQSSLDELRLSLFDESREQRISARSRGVLLGAFEEALQNVEKAGSILHHLISSAQGGPERAA